MARLGRFLTWVGLIAIAILGVWLYRTADRQARMLGLGNGTPLVQQPQFTPTIYPSAATIIEDVQTLSRLETASYHIEKVITAESGQGPLGFLFGDKLLLIAYGEVIAGVDLSTLGPGDVMVSPDGTVYIRMPAVEIFVATLDNQRTRVYDRRTGVAGANAQLETAARQEAERMILQAAIEEGIESKAEENARAFLRSFVLGFGFENVIFVDALPTIAPAPTLLVTVTSP
ncbi:MAG: DUF4230 domain-containing protein [Anaerolineae bacterium]|nr:DUF4230 domain-containing protein [Anaerolineae bacterium]